MSELVHTVKMDDDVWMRLWDLKLKMRAKSLDEVVDRLMRERKA